MWFGAIKSDQLRWTRDGKAISGTKYRLRLDFRLTKMGFPIDHSAECTAKIRKIHFLKHFQFREAERYPKKSEY
jgi:hypothetical protein